MACQRQASARPADCRNARKGAAGANRQQALPCAAKGKYALDVGTHKCDTSLMTDPSREPTEAEIHAYAEHFRQVLRDEHGVTLSCPLCGSDDWMGFGDVGLPILQGRKPTGEIDGIPGSLHVIAASCRKCGLVSLFDRDVIGG
jgi:hypothetical protein